MLMNLARRLKDAEMEKHRIYWDNRDMSQRRKFKGKDRSCNAGVKTCG